MNHGWVEIYRQISRLLVELRDNELNRGNPNVGMKLYELCMDSQYREEFIDLNPWIIKFRKVHGVDSIDPLHIFASINSWKINEITRIKKLSLYYKILNDGKEFVELNYVNMNVFKFFPHIQITRVVSARSLEEQNDVWEFFISVFYGELDKSHFTRVLKHYGIAFPSLTIFMFWVNSDEYIPLDKNTLFMLEQKNKRFLQSKNAKSYYDILRSDINKSKNLYRNLAYMAIDLGGRSEFPYMETIEINNYFSFIEGLNEDILSVRKFKDNTTKNTITKNKFNIFAIKPLDDCSKIYLKKLSTNTTYYLNKVYKIIDEGSITYFPNNDINLYTEENDIMININAIVGQNGAGKSALSELLLLTINNMTAYLDKKKNTDIELYNENSLNIEIYFFFKYAYKIKYKNNKLTVFKYIEENNNVYSNPIEDKEFNLNDFFYTIYVNYSLYSLNSSDDGYRWLKQLFHKNDAYQTPVVIDPKRTDGDMNINNITYLAKNRLLTRLLMPFTEEEEKFGYKSLTDSKAAVKFQLNINKQKVDLLNDTILSIHVDTNIIIKHYFGIDNFDFSNNDDKSLAVKYVIYKVINIYKKYKTVYKNYNLESKLEDFLKALDERPSHITFKLRQSVNFYKLYSQLKNIYKKDIKLNFKTVSEELENIRKKNNLHIIELMPPAYYEPAIYVQEVLKDDNKVFGNDIDFKTLSSGEKQMVYSINSIVYHIENLNSVDNIDSKLYKYDAINIILDEIELYFHPEFQRIFVDVLLKELKKNFEGLDFGVKLFNIIFITHSPFVLSDIVHSNILLLGDETTDELTTFASNIHDMLSKTFFINDTIGEFAISKISEIVKFYEQFSKTKHKQKLREEYSKKQKLFHFIVSNIGEKYIKGVLENHLNEIERELEIENDKYIKKKIDSLEEELIQLKEKLVEHNS